MLVLWKTMQMVLLQYIDYKYQGIGYIYNSTITINYDIKGTLILPDVEPNSGSYKVNNLVHWHNGHILNRPMW